MVWTNIFWSQVVSNRTCLKGFDGVTSFCDTKAFLGLRGKLREGRTKNPKENTNWRWNCLQVIIPSPEIKWWDKVSAVYDQILKTFCFRKRSLERCHYKVKHNNLFFGSPFVLFLALRFLFCPNGLFWSSLPCKHLRGLHKWTTWRPKAWLQNLKGHYDKMHATYFQVEWRCWKIKCTSVWWKSIGFHWPWCGWRTIICYLIWWKEEKRIFGGRPEV